MLSSFLSGWARHLSSYLKRVYTTPVSVNVVSDLEANFTRLNRIVHQRGVFSSLLDGYRTNSFNVEGGAATKVRDVAVEGLWQQTIVKIIQNECRVLLALNERLAITCYLHLVPQEVIPYLLWISAFSLRMYSICDCIDAPDSKLELGRPTGS